MGRIDPPLSANMVKLRNFLDLKFSNLKFEFREAKTGGKHHDRASQ
jgi:hypothetical protein